MKDCAWVDCVCPNTPGGVKDGVDSQVGGGGSGAVADEDGLVGRLDEGGVEIGH
jgi:hypothetical protein